MPKDVFSFQRFSLCQDRCAMKVGTDGVLLGAWAEGGRRILDIGAGTGIISLMMAQRFPLSDVEGVEADPQAAGQAAENARAFPRVTIRHARLQDWQPPEPYDCLVSNPPFFVDSLKTPHAQRTLARHDVDLSFSDIFAFAQRALIHEGVLSVILPSEVVERFCENAFLSGFRMHRHAMIKTTERKPFKRHLLAFSKDASRRFECTKHCLLTPDGGRSEWYQQLTKDFYVR